MKRLILTITLGILLVLAGCESSASQSNVPVISDRLDAIEQRLSELEQRAASEVEESDVDDLRGEIAALRGEFDTLNSEFDVVKADVSAVKNGMSSFEEDIESRLLDIEDELSPDEQMIDGEVLVTLEDVPDEFASSSKGSELRSFVVMIVNNTNKYQDVSYWIQLVNIGPEDVDGVKEASIFSPSEDNPKLEVSSGGIFSPSLYKFDCILIPNNPTKFSKILFTPPEDLLTMPVGRGKTVKIYHTLYMETDDFEIWDMSLTEISTLKVE